MLVQMTRSNKDYTDEMSHISLLKRRSVVSLMCSLLPKDLHSERIMVLKKIFCYVRGLLFLPYAFGLEIISIFHERMVWIEKSVTRVTARHHEACRVVPNSDPE